MLKKTKNLSISDTVNVNFPGLEGKVVLIAKYEDITGEVEWLVEYGDGRMDRFYEMWLEPVRYADWDKKIDRLKKWI